MIDRMAVWRENICLLLLLFLLFFFGCCCASAMGHPGVSGLESGSQNWWHVWEDTGQPSLATEQVNMTAFLGHTVTLPCRVINLNDKTVSWIRSRDLTVLAVDRVTVTTDARISVVHPEETEDWLLEIRGVAKTDEGTYECQVNTHPKISTKVHLKVIPDQGHMSILDIPVSDTGVIAEPKDEGSSLRVRVIGRRWVTLPEGSTLHLVCEAAGRDLQAFNHHSLVNNDPLISWTLDGIPVTSLWPHSKVLVRESWSGSTVESEVEVTSLQKGDGGTFACNVPRVPPDLVTVSVVESEYTETQAKLASFEVQDSSDTLHVEEDDDFGTGVAGAAGKAAVISGAIILALLVIQAGLCIFYIKKV